MDIEYFIVKDENNIPIGKRRVITKNMLENAPVYVVNGSLMFGLSEFTAMQELAKNLTEVE